MSENQAEEIVGDFDVPIIMRCIDVKFIPEDADNDEPASYAMTYVLGIKDNARSFEEYQPTRYVIKQLAIKEYVDAHGLHTVAGNLAWDSAYTVLCTAVFGKRELADGAERTSQTLEHFLRSDRARLAIKELTAFEDKHDVRPIDNEHLVLRERLLTEVEAKLPPDTEPSLAARKWQALQAIVVRHRKESEATEPGSMLGHVTYAAFNQALESVMDYMYLAEAEVDPANATPGPTEQGNRQREHNHEICECSHVRRVHSMNMPEGTDDWDGECAGCVHVEAGQLASATGEFCKKFKEKTDV